MITWIKQMRAAFGTSFLWLVCLIYFTQGFRSFVWTAVSYQLKDILKLSPSASQFVVSIAFFPWSIKPFYGILSDCIPIRGRKRVPYLVIATTLSLVPWLIMGLKASIRSSRVPLTIVLTVQNLGSAMADVVIDAMIAEAVRLERASFAGDLQSISWSAMAFGGICGSLLGGYTLANLPMDMIFLLFSVLPTIQLLSCGLVKEAPLGSGTLLDHVDSRSSNNLGNYVVNGNATTSSDSDGPLQKLERVETSKGGTSRRRKRSRKNKKEKAIIKEPEIQHKSFIMRCFLSIKSAIFSLCRAFRQPIILRPMAWFFFAHVTVPNLSTVMFYYQTEFLHLEPSFLGTVRVVGWFGLMLGTFIYSRYLKHMKLRRILMWAHVGLAIMSLFDLVLVSRLNVQYGIPDKVMVLWGSALSDVISQLKMMPFLIISGQLCPPGIEGTLFALFMSVNNLGNTLSSFVGAGLASILNISSNSFDNLLLGISIQVICTFVPVGFLFLIPKEATGLSA
ncbi:probable folate-biopterin transporter 4 [Magnolia sinica]|uniref:probable folate-biopterin transporter 4 n=1 Tax=Magnolia sinica TaxID=86752 RepID=UPI00265948B1|nr:probable folate-biopterin transporter 4 [Magnolia sinica]